MTFTGISRKFILTLVGALAVSASALAASEGLPLDAAPNRTQDVAALQNGAKLFVNYCLNCHSAAFMRYSRLTDLGLTEQQIKDNLLPPGAKLGETMKSAIDPKQAAQWFGANPPDLTVIARSRAGEKGSGADYLYTYLRTFYRDETRPTGWNNLAFPKIAMPHVLWELQGSRRAVFETEKDNGQDVQVFKSWEQLTPGTMTPAQYDDAMGDLVSYLQWMGEPIQNTRKHIGVWVLLFLGVLIFFTWRLNAAYWKEVK